MFNTYSSPVQSLAGPNTLFAWFYCSPSRDSKHFHSLYPAFKDARTIAAPLAGQSAFLSVCHNLDRGEFLDYPTLASLQAFFFEDAVEMPISMTGHEHT